MKRVTSISILGTYQFLLVFENMLHCYKLSFKNSSTQALEKGWILQIVCSATTCFSVILTSWDLYEWQLFGMYKWWTVSNFMSMSSIQCLQIIYQKNKQSIMLEKHFETGKWCRVRASIFHLNFKHMFINYLTGSVFFFAAHKRVIFVFVHQHK